MVWNHREILHSDEPMIIHGLRALIDLNPDWTVTLYTPPDIDQYLREYLQHHEYQMVCGRNFVSRTDIWRMIKMFNEGGLYMDLDRLVNIPLCHILDDDRVTWVCPTHDEYDFSNDFLLSAPGNPVFAITAQMYLQRLQQGWHQQFLLGPQIFMHACTLELCGEIIDINPGQEKFDFIRQRIAQYSFIKTYREIRHNDMIIYRGSMGDELESMKRQFYAKEGVRHWTGDW